MKIKLDENKKSHLTPSKILCCNKRYKKNI